MKRMGKLHREDSGFSIPEVILVVLVVLGLAFALNVILHHHHKASTATVSTSVSAAKTSTSSTESSYAVLSPASVAPKVSECSQTVTFSSNGSSGPITCANGELNVLAWKALAALEPKVMTLGYSATATQVQAALCADTGANVSNPIEETNYQIAALYYGWNFTTNPSVVLTNGTCVNADD